jgi:RHS repeat-associated protein
MRFTVLRFLSHSIKSDPAYPRRLFRNYLLKTLMLLIIGCAVAPTVSAQNIQFTQGNVGSGLENSLQIPLLSYPGRGAASLPVTLHYSSKVWRINHLKTITYGTYLPITEAIFAEHSTAGWKTSLDIPKIEWPKSTDGFFYSGGPYNFAAYPSANAFKVRRVYIHMPNGSRHELRENDQPYQGAIDMVGTFYAVDGSRIRYDSTGIDTGTLYLPDGVRYVLNGSTAQYIDRNGNTLNYNGSTRQWTDTLGRVVGIPLPANPLAQDYTYTLNGIGGPLTYTFRWRYLADALTPDQYNQTPARKPIANEYLPNPSQPPTPPSGGNYPVMVQTSYSERPSLFISDADESGENYAVVVGHNQNGGELFNPVVLTEIVLPNGLSYKFSYNIYAEIDKVVYPTGAFDRYTYSELPGIGYIQTPYVQANRGVTKRQLSADGTGTDFAEWQYSVAVVFGDTSVPSGSMRFTAKAPDNTRTESYKHNLRGDGKNFGFEDAINGMEFDERLYAPNPDGSKGPLMRRKLTLWEKTSNPVPPRTSLPGDVTKTAYRNARPAKEVSLILDTGGDALAKTLTYTYDTTYQLSTGLDQLSSTESQFESINQTTAQTGMLANISFGPGTPASSTETVYLNDANYRDRNMLSLASLVLLKDGNGQVVSKTEKFYDEAAYPVLTYGDLAGVPDYVDPQTTARGNVTTLRRYTDIGANLYLETHAQYDQCGNVRNAWNERGILSQVSYSSTYKHAYGTSATTAVPDPTGQHGSNAGFTTSSVFDYATGLALSTTDANGQTTTFSYADEQNVVDPLNRLRKVTRADGGWTSYYFNDVIGNFYSLTTTKIDAARVAQSYQYSDALGRVNRSAVFEGGTNYLVTDTQYDSMSRVWRSSNPYRAQSLGGAVNPSGLWTTSAYDALSRVKQITLTDGTTLQTNYQGIYTTINDQAGKQRRQKTDSLGRVVRVDEPDAVSGALGGVDTPAFPTFYDYDSRGNLVHVAQGEGAQTQHRYFKYDALSRLTHERQVEQSAVHNASDALTGNSQWSRRIVYDENNYQGLMTSTYDARLVSTQYVYDNLNRIYQVTYSDSTPAVNNYYDQARAGAFNKTRLTQVTTAAAPASGQIPSIPATSVVYDYDLMGRVKNHQQQVDTNTYTLSYGYDFGGQLTSETYPSGRVVNYAYDDASRLSQVSSGSTTYATQFVYGTKGMLTSVAWGNNAVESYDYNDRLQLREQSLAKDGATIQRYEYKYGRVATDGTIDETKNTGQIGRVESFIGAARQWQQRYTYDYLGRLSAAAEHRGDNLQQTFLLNYDFDTFGNRYQKQSRNSGNTVAQTWVEDADVSKATNRFTSGVTYDSAGNVTLDQKFRQLQAQYDANNRPKWSANSDGTGAVTSIYDGSGQRVATKINGALNVMVYDAYGKLVAEYGQASGTRGTQYVMTDKQGAPRVALNASGAVVARHDYQPYGDELYSGTGLRTTAQGYDASDGIKTKYAGMEADETGLSHTLWRQYDSRAGRWTAPDPYGGSMTVADPQSFNRYTYVNNDPVNMTDPLGLMAADASQGWSAFEGWGGSPGLNDPHFGGPGIIREAEALHDALVQARVDGMLAQKYINEGNFAAAQAIFERNSDVGLYQDGEAMWGGEAANYLGENSYSVTVSATVNGVTATTHHNPASLQEGQWSNITFETLWSNHPGYNNTCVDARGNVPEGYGHQCACRMSTALTRSGISLASVKTKKGGRLNGLVVRAYDLGNWLLTQLGPPLMFSASRGSTNSAETLRGKTGIVLFRGLYANNTLGHIDVWDGRSMRMGNGTNDYFDRAREVWFWEIR